ncbi:hypothetical protein A3Q32_11110 [Alcanivorax sp. KX64203]|nr:hypothetical protein A3Q32_11110 [Alcanivorax sp. KX64203]
MIQAPPLFATPAGADQDAGVLLAQCLTEDPDWPHRAAAAGIPPLQGRLGHWFEALVAALLAHSQRLELLARNVPLRRQGRTLGEMDMVLFDHGSGRRLHWELALKFFLGHDGQWPGPNPRDTLQSKAEHLFQRQLPRSLDVSAAEPPIAPVDHRQALTRGRLFYPTPPCPPPAQAAHGHQRGFWCRAGHWNTPARPVPRAFWAIPELLSDNFTSPVAPTELQDYVQRKQSVVMILTDNNAPGFLVPDTWPFNELRSPA